MAAAALRLSAGALVLAASVFLATDGRDPGLLQFLAAGLIAVPAAHAFAQGLSELLGHPPVRTRRRVKWALKSALIYLQRNGYRGDITTISLHVWVLPLWYRRMPARIKERAKQDGAHVRRLLQPRLRRLAMYRIEHQGASRVQFKLGAGLVGRCLLLNNKASASVVRLSSAEFQAALGDDMRWAESSSGVHQNLTRTQAQELAKRYSEAAAHVLHEPSGEPLGCVTVSLDSESGASFADSSSDPLIQALKTATDSVENLLTTRR